MLLTVNKYLNIRVGKPNTNASCPGYLQPGDMIELESVEPGDELDGNAVWYKSKKGYFYWSGGITEVAFELPGIQVTPALRIALINDILHNHCSDFRKSVPGYLGCGAGTDANGVPVIRILVDRQKGGAAVPFFVTHKGIRLNFIIEMISAPIFHGFGPGNVIAGDFENGTAAVAVGLKGVAGQFLLGSYHVIASNQLDHNQKIVSPGSGLQVTLRNGDGSRLLLVYKGEFSDIVDYALALLPDNVGWENKFDQIIISGIYSKEQVQAAEGSFVQSLGAKTQSRAQVLDGLYEITLAGFSFKDVIRTQRMSVPGDSGAVVFGDNHKILGFVLGGDDLGNSYLIPAYQLEKKDIVFK